MQHLTARLLLVLLLAGTFVPVGLAIAAPQPHACCVRKPLHGFRSLQAQNAAEERSNCCPPVVTAHWAQLKPGLIFTSRQLLAYLRPQSHPGLRSKQGHALQPVRGPPSS